MIVCALPRLLRFMVGPLGMLHKEAAASSMLDLSLSSR